MPFIVIIVGIGFAESGEHFLIVEECVFIGSDIHESGLQGRFKVDDPAQIDVTHFGFIIVPFDLVFFQTAVFEQGETAFQFFAVQNDLLAFVLHSFFPTINL